MANTIGDAIAAAAEKALDQARELMGEHEDGGILLVIGEPAATQIREMAEELGVPASRMTGAILDTGLFVLNMKNHLVETLKD